MGITGSGKSTFISKLVDAEIMIGHQLQSCTSEVRSYGFLHQTGRRVFLLDTPGFDDTSRSDTDVLKTIAKNLVGMYSKDIKLSGIIYLHRITDVRFTGSAYKNISVFKKLCGENCYPNVVLATTMWENLGGSGNDTTLGDQRETQLVKTREWWGLMTQRGSKIFRHMDNKRSALEIVDYLTKLNQKVVLEIQSQIVDEKKNLQDTGAGLEVERELQEAKIKHAKEKQELEEEKAQAVKDKDVELAEMYRQDSEKLDAAIQKAEKDREALYINYQQMMEQSETRSSRMLQQFQQQMADELARERRRNEDAQRRRDEALDREKRRYEEAQRRGNEEIARERARNEDWQRLQTEENARERRRNENAQRQRDQGFAAERAMYEADLRRREAGMASQNQQLESTISGLRAQVSDLAFRSTGTRSTPSTLPDEDEDTRSTPSTIPNEDEDSLPDEDEDSPNPDADTDSRPFYGGYDENGIHVLLRDSRDWPKAGAPQLNETGQRRGRHS
ncbi:MAG: hypothetical protein Q9226_007073 [Calogaya cf. arnoldii]